MPINLLNEIALPASSLELETVTLGMVLERAADQEVIRKECVLQYELALSSGMPVLLPQDLNDEPTLDRPKPGTVGHHP
jgi:hypothetical protein